jgi:heme/copper-type cytochrome/quinol oxidase subunit 3
MENQEISQPTKDVFADHPMEVKVRTKKMMMWLIILAVVMLFAGVTSAVMVLYGKLLWVQIVPPFIFWVGNALVIISSLTMILAVRALKSGNSKLALAGVVVTLMLGLAFVYTQNKAWIQMTGLGFGRTETQTEQGAKSRWNTLGELQGEYGKDYTFLMNGQVLQKEGDRFIYTKADGSKEDKSLEVKTTFNASGAMLSILVYLHIAHLFLGILYLIVNIIRIAKGKLHKNEWISLYSNGMYWHFMGILWLYLFAFLFFIY